MVLSNNEELHEKIVKHLRKNGIGASCVLARNILFMCDEALNTAPQKTAHNN